jgi:hypothetical protein
MPDQEIIRFHLPVPAGNSPESKKQFFYQNCPFQRVFRPIRRKALD